MHGNLKQRDGGTLTVAEDPPQRTWEDARIDMRAMLGLLRRHKWLVAVTVVLVVGLAALVTLQLTKRYTATALVVVDSRDSQLLGFQPGVGDAYSNNSMVDTEVEIAKSSQVLRRAAEMLDLGNSPDFAPRPPLSEMILSMFGMGTERSPEEPEDRIFTSLPPGEQAAIVESLGRASEINRIGLTSVISISATMSSPDGAAAAANALADAYLDEQIEAKLRSTDRAVTFLRERVATLAREIAEREAELDSFVQNNIAELGSPAAKELLSQLSAESRRRDDTRATLSTLQGALLGQDFARLAALDGASGLATKREELVAQLSRVDDGALLADARRQLDALDEQLRSSARQRLTSLQQQIDASVDRSTTLREQMGQELVALQLPQEVSVHLFQLQRDIEARRDLYDSFVAKLQQVEQQSGFNIPDSRVIAAAVPPVRASFPPTRAILGASLFLSICAGIGLAFLREHFIGGITSVGQFESMAGIPVVAAIPRFSGDANESPDQAIVRQPLSAYSEAIRRAQLGIIPLGDKGSRCIFVTSALPGDGKSTVALSLARQAALTGSATLVIDADLRHPSIGSYLGERVEGGLIQYLSQSARGDSVEIGIVKEASSGVDFVLGGAPSTGSTDTLLMSPRFDDLMRFARENYETIIIDTPPVGLVVDATIVARHCNAGVFVVRYASTSQRIVRSSIRELMGRTDVPIYGVLNVVARADSYGQYGKYRQYYQTRAA